MRRPLSLVVLALVAFALPAMAQMNIPAGTAAVVVVYTPFASPMRTYEQASSAALWESGSVIETQDQDAPWLVVTTQSVMICVGSGQSLSNLVSDYTTQRNRTRPYIAERFASRGVAEDVLRRMQEYGAISEAWIVDARDGGAILVYRNPNA